MTSFRKPAVRKSSPRAPDAGVALPGGLAIAALTAGIVFAVGAGLLPTPQPAPPPAPVQAPPPVPPPPPPPPTPPALPGSDGAVDAPPLAATGDAGSVKTAKADEAPPAEKPPEAADEGTANPRKASDKDTQADKNTARESWRKNQPDISASGARASILIPIKGTTDGASSKFLLKKRTLVVTLPSAASLNTLKFYRLNREGYLSLWVDRGEPQVELGDGFVRATILRPGTAPPADDAKPAPAETEDKDKAKVKETKESEKDKDGG
jgi:hypothetical protein